MILNSIVKYDLNSAIFTAILLTVLINCTFNLKILKIILQANIGRHCLILLKVLLYLEQFK